VTREKKIGFIGAGNMAEALIKGLISKRIVDPENISASDVSAQRLNHVGKNYGIKIVTDNRNLISRNDIIILAVKPGDVYPVLDEIRDQLNSRKVLVSIAAGVRLSKIEKRLKRGSRVVRVMPNTPALILEAASALSKGKFATDKDLDCAKALFDAVGETAIVKEELMDAVTGLSGSGPAYIFMIIEALSDAGVKVGLNRELAQSLTIQTLIGAAKLVKESGKHPGRLKDMVASPGGTTIAGIHALEKGRLRGILMDAVEAATRRSKELGDVP
jgi:pyrroline-5-carboxylate reductase